MRITKEQGKKIKKAILDRGYSITGFCRIHNISDRQFYAWLAGTNGYERNGIGKHFQDITDALFADKALDVATQSHIVDVYGLPEIKQTKAQEES
jgi:transposase-like protein